MQTQEVVQSGVLAEDYTEVFLPGTQIQILNVTPVQAGNYSAYAFDFATTTTITLTLTAEQTLEVQA